MAQMLSDREIIQMLGPVESLVLEMRGIEWHGKPSGIKIPYSSKTDADNDANFVGKAAAKLGWGGIVEEGQRRLQCFKVDVIEQDGQVYLRILRIRE